MYEYDQHIGTDGKLFPLSLHMFARFSYKSRSTNTVLTLTSIILSLDFENYNFEIGNYNYYIKEITMPA